MVSFWKAEFNYNLYSKEEEVTTSSSDGEYFNTIEEVTLKYGTFRPGVIEDSAFSIGLGRGLNYKFSRSLELGFIYIFRYYDSILTENQILL